MQGLLQFVRQNRSSRGRIAAPHIPISNTDLLRTGRPFQIITQKTAAVGIVVAVYTQIFPVTAVRRIIVMVAVFVVDRQELPLHS